MWPSSAIIDGWLESEGFYNQMAERSPLWRFARTLRQTGLAEWERMRRLKRGCRR